MSGNNDSNPSWIELTTSKEVIARPCLANAIWLQSGQRGKRECAQGGNQVFEAKGFAFACHAEENRLCS